MANIFDELVPRKIHSQNVVDRMITREIYGTSYKRSPLNCTQGFYTNIFPNYSLINVERPPCFLRKFSPDGKRFITFSNCQTQLEIYFYKGPSALNDMVLETSGISSDIPGEDPELVQRLKALAFDSVFTLEQIIPVCRVGVEQLDRECSLFSEDSDFVIVGSASYIPDDVHPQMHELNQNNESVAANPRNPLENYTIYSIEMAEGILTDKITFKMDKIFLSHNQGIYLFKNVLAILSVQHQTVHVFKYHNGNFIPEVKVGRLLYQDDSLLLGQTLTPEQQTELPTNRNSAPVYRAFREKTINLLKHRILNFLYRRAKHYAIEDGKPYELRRFYQFFDQICGLRMWKMQLLDEQHLLIKYANEEVVTLRCREPNAQPSYFVVYNFVTTEVLAFHENTSKEMLTLYENFCDFFRNINMNLDIEEFRYSHFTASPCNNIYANLMQQRFMQTIISAKNGGITEARKRILAQLPISAQSYSSSPYLDLNIFSYDEKWISGMERPKASSDHPIQFYGRESGLFKFKVHAGLPERMGGGATPSSRRLVAFIFHPTDPFAISVQKAAIGYVVNFHVRKAPTSANTT